MILKKKKKIFLTMVPTKHMEALFIRFVYFYLENIFLTQKWTFAVIASR